MKRFRLIALILALIIAVAVLASCNSDEDNDLNNGSDASDTGNADASGDQIGQLDTEKLVVFSDGAYRA